MKLLGLEGGAAWKADTQLIIGRAVDQIGPEAFPTGIWQYTDSPESERRCGIPLPRERYLDAQYVPEIAQSTAGVAPGHHLQALVG